MSSKTKLVLKRNKKVDKLYHPESGLVFKSETERLVIGRLSGDEFISLDDEALELCEKYRFKYDESLVETISEEPNEEEQPPKEETPSISPPENPLQIEDKVVEVSPTQDKVVEDKVVEDKVVEDKSKITVVESFSVQQNKPEQVTDFSKYINVITNLYVNKEIELQNSVKKQRDLEDELNKVNKEHEELKRKFKNVLSAMQETL